MTTMIVDTDGVVRAVKSDTLGWMEAEGACSTRRASHIVPLGPWRRLAFRLLRRVFGDSGRAADWTRRWQGPWAADLRPSGGPVLEHFWSRQDAIRTELGWLRANRGL